MGGTDVRGSGDPQPDGLGAVDRGGVAEAVVSPTGPAGRIRRRSAHAAVCFTRRDMFFPRANICDSGMFEGQT